MVYMNHQFIDQVCLALVLGLENCLDFNSVPDDWPHLPDFIWSWLHVGHGWLHSSFAGCLQISRPKGKEKKLTLATNICPLNFIKIIEF